MENDNPQEPTNVTPMKKRRGPPPGFKRHVQSTPTAKVEIVSAPVQPAPATMEAPKTPVPERESYTTEVERIRDERTKNAAKRFGTFKQKLALAPRNGYHRHWFNDEPGRLDEARTSGWTHVEDKDGRPIKRIVGKAAAGGGLYAFAMEIPQVFWEEDMAEQFAAAKKPMDAIKSSPFQAKAGQAKAQDSEKFYSPRESVLDIQRK